MSGSVLIFTTAKSGTGVPRFNEIIAADLLESGYSVTVAQPFDPNYAARMGPISEAKRHYFDRDPYDNITAFGGDKRLAAKLFLEIEPDLVIFSNGIHPLSSMAGMQAARFLSIPYVVVDGLIAHSLFNLDETTLKVTSALYQQAAAVIVKSHENLTNLRRFLHLPDTVGMSILSGRSDDFFEPVNPIRRHTIRTQLNIPDDAILFFSAAKFEPVKGYRYQIAAMRALQETDVWERLYFAWAGDGMDFQATKETLSELGLLSHVRLLGHRTDIAALLDAADCFVLVSRAEAAPLAIMEAMAKRIPVIGTEIGGIPEALDGTGTLVASPENPKQTVRDLAEAIAEHVRDDNLRRRNGDAGRERAEKEFRVNRMTASYREIFEKAILSGARRMSPS